MGTSATAFARGIAAGIDATSAADNRYQRSQLHPPH